MLSRTDVENIINERIKKSLDIKFSTLEKMIERLNERIDELDILIK